MFRQLSGQQQADRGLDFAAADGRTLVVVRQTAGFSGDPFENVVHERVHDRHRLAGNSSVRVDLLHHLVDVAGIGLLSPASPFLPVRSASGLLSGFLRSFRAHLRRHLRFALVFVLNNAKNTYAQ